MRHVPVRPRCSVLFVSWYFSVFYRFIHFRKFCAPYGSKLQFVAVLPIAYPFRKSKKQYLKKTVLKKVVLKTVLKKQYCGKPVRLAPHGVCQRKYGSWSLLRLRRPPQLHIEGVQTPDTFVMYSRVE